MSHKIIKHLHGSKKISHNYEKSIVVRKDRKESFIKQGWEVITEGDDTVLMGKSSK